MTSGQDDRPQLWPKTPWIECGVWFKKSPMWQYLCLAQKFGWYRRAVFTPLFTITWVCERFVSGGCLIYWQMTRQWRVRRSWYFLTEFVESKRKRLSSQATSMVFPHKLQNKAWVVRGDLQPTVLRADFHSCKQMFVVFMTSSGHWMWLWCRKVNATCYTLKSCYGWWPPSRTKLREAFAEFCCTKTRPATLWLWLGNSSKSLQLVPHPPYSPDLALLDL